MRKSRGLSNRALKIDGRQRAENLHRVDIRKTSLKNDGETQSGDPI